MFRFPVRAARGTPSTLHLENMKFFQKQPWTDAELVTSVEPRSAEYVNHSWSHLPEQSINLYTSGQTNTGQVTVICKGLVDEQQHSLSFSSIPAMMSRILDLTTGKENRASCFVTCKTSRARHCCRRRKPTSKGTQQEVKMAPRMG